MSTIETIIGIIEEVTELPEGSVKQSDDLMHQLDMDSLDKLDAIFKVEKEFEIEFDDSEVEKIKTVQDLIDHTMVKTHENYDR